MTPLGGVGFAGRHGRRMWFTAISCLVIIGLTAAALLINWATLFVVFAVIVGMVAPLHLSIATVTEDLTFSLLRMVVKWAVRAAASTLAVCGYAAAIGFATLPLLGVVGLTAWFVFGTSGTRMLDEPVGKDAAVTMDLRSPEILSDEELCAAWRRSFAVLENCRTAEDRQAVANLRRRCLDELERRRPDAFAEWLKAGPQAAGDAAEYFVRGSRRRDAAD